MGKGRSHEDACCKEEFEKKTSSWGIYNVNDPFLMAPRLLKVDTKSSKVTSLLKNVDEKKLAAAVRISRCPTPR